MLEKILFDRLLKLVEHGALTVTYWDGQSKKYGSGEPYFELVLHRPSAVRQILMSQTLGFGEAYMNGDLDIKGPLDNVVRLLAENSGFDKKLKTQWFKKRLKRNTKARQKRYIQHHYDLGNDFYKLWLDETMAYSCAYFKRKSDSLELAQSQKVDHILTKLRLEKGQSLLDIGCGWGTLLFRAAEQHGVSGLGITLSEEQFRHCQAGAKRRGLSKTVKFQLINYQDLAKNSHKFNRIVSVGMFEHVGRYNQIQYFSAIDDLLKPGGLSVLHTISASQDWPEDPWIDKYIFPGGHLPTVESVVSSLYHNGFRLTDYEDLKIHYALTLDEWWWRFEKHKKKVIDMYDQRFYRMWRLWLAGSSASFRYGEISVSQFVFVKGVKAENQPLTRQA